MIKVHEVEKIDGTTFVCNFKCSSVEFLFIRVRFVIDISLNKILPSSFCKFFIVKHYYNKKILSNCCYSFQNPACDIIWYDYQNWLGFLNIIAGSSFCDWVGSTNDFSVSTFRNYMNSGVFHLNFKYAKKIIGLVKHIFEIEK